MKNQILALTFFLATSVGAVARADLNSSPTLKGGDQHPCLEEVKKACPNVAMGPELGKCIQQNKDKFSPACQARMKEGAEKMKTMIEACKGDVEKVCAGIAPGGGKVFQCLKTNAAKLSPACKAQIDKAPPM